MDFFSKQGAAFQVYKMYVTFITASVKVGRQEVAQLGWILGGANHYNAFGIKKRSKGVFICHSTDCNL